MQLIKINIIIFFCVLFAISNFVQASSIDAISFLKTNQPIQYPFVRLASIDPKERDIVKFLYDKQWDALLELKGIKDSSLIPLLVPFLDYSTYPVPPYYNKISFRKKVQPTLHELSEHFPAVAIIAGIPNNANELTKYAKDDKRSLNYRMAAFQLLRYIDIQMFDVVSKDFDKEFATANQPIKDYLKGIKNGDVPFEGIFPVHTLFD